MGATRDPFRTLHLPYDAGPDDVRQAFRRLAQRTHPDRGGSARAFHDVRVAYGALADDLEGERSRWRPPPPTRASRYAAGLDPAVYPTCPVRVRPPRPGTPTVLYEIDARPSTWAPGAVPPPGGTCVSHIAATDTSPAFGVWVVPVGAKQFRCVFGPPPAASGA
ncbi:MAG: J domain-containing protein [Bacteroidota bacterium]